MASRPGAWLRSLIAGLIDRPPLGWREYPLDPEWKRTVQIPVWANRVQEQLEAPKYLKQLRA